MNKLYPENLSSQVSVAPNGNGGLWSALNTTGVLADMERRGIKLVCSYPVDNILVRVIDPIFVGFTFATKADVACKVVPKVQNYLLSTLPQLAHYSLNKGICHGKSGCSGTEE